MPKQTLKSNLDNEVILGFDPGGLNNFGWAVLRHCGHALPIFVGSGHCSNPDQAIQAAIHRAKAEVAQAKIIAAGIDAPLFWVSGISNGQPVFQRQADIELAIRRNANVMSVNALRGACLVRGMICANLLENLKIQVVESHPGAVINLIQQRGAQNMPMQDQALLEHFIQQLPPNEHEGDAAITGLAAWAWHINHPDWDNLTDIQELENVTRYTLLGSHPPYMAP